MDESVWALLQISGAVISIGYLLYVIITIAQKNFLEKKNITARLLLSLVLVAIFASLGSWFAAVVWMVNVGINTWSIWRENQQEKPFWQ